MTTLKTLATRAALAALLSIGAGCGGMAAYNLPKDEPDPLTLDECPELCAQAIEAGCDLLACDVDVARDWTLGIDILVFHLDGATDGGGGCEMVVDCPELDGCTLDYQACLADFGDVPYCNEHYEFCRREEVCSPAFEMCNTTAQQQLDWCDENTPDEDCMYEYLVTLDACQCTYDDCLTDEELDRVPEAAMMISPPVQTGPFAFTVGRAFLDQQLDRLAALDAETRGWLVPNGDDTAWRGFRLADVDAGEPIHLAGLRTGDVIRTVNGHKLTEVMGHPNQLLALRNTALVTVGVERAGIVRQFKFTLVD